ncbi:MAG: tetratricopeptide repeat protein [Polyangiaceae bacterium]|nr:tetratricopeptide repeat protein [Polyangiaceae bacterium]
MVERAAVVALAVALGCAPSLPARYAEARAAAERAYASGRYDEAATHWQRAHDEAERPRDQADALYRRAASLRRSGRSALARAVLDDLVRQHPRSHRADRAHYDRCDLVIESGAASEGFDCLTQLVKARPRSPLALHAADRSLRHVEHSQGAQAALGWAVALEPAVRGTAVDEQLRFRRAELLERAGRPAEARAVYRDTARAFPYPIGAYWDDALIRAARIDVGLGRLGDALDATNILLAERETSHLQGSYDKPAFAEARLLRASIYEQQGQPERAVAELRRLFHEHPHSLLRDDALWREARLAGSMGDQRRACSALGLLRRELPDSRFAPCAQLLCSALGPLEGRSCRDYVARELK